MRTLPALAIAILLAPHASAQLTVNNELALTPSDGTPGDTFGSAIDASGDSAIVGAPLHDPSGVSDAGAAYVYRRLGSGWAEEAKLVASDPDIGNEFGGAVALDGDTAVVGSWRDDTENGLGSGSLYVFVRSGTTWTQQARLVPADLNPGDELGFAVAVDGDTIFAGAPGDDAAAPEAGAVHVFTRSGSTWTRVQKLQAPQASADDRFGEALDVDGDRAGVGAPSSGTNSGRVFAFDRVGGTWDAGLALFISGGNSGARIGASIDITGDTFVVGAPDMPRFTAQTRFGGAVAFKREANGWGFHNFVFAANGVGGDQFGSDVVARPERVFVGSSNVTIDSAAGQGAIYAFDEVPLQGFSLVFEQTLKTSTASAGAGSAFGSRLAWTDGELLVGSPVDGSGTVLVQRIREAFPTSTEVQSYEAPSIGSVQSLGWSTALDGDTLVAGAPGFIAPTVGFSIGAVHVFTRSLGGPWGTPVVVAPGDVSFGDGFGASVDVEGNRFVATGADLAGGGDGATYVYRRSGTTWSLEQKLTPPDLAPQDGVGPVALSGTTLAVGASRDDGPVGDLQGSVNLYVRTGTSWTHQQRLQPSASDTLFFGLSLALDGDTLLVGDNVRAYVYRRTGTTWNEEAQLQPQGQDIPGWSVDVQGDTAVVGSVNDASEANFATGAAYVFERSGTSWTQTAKLLDPRLRNSGFGYRVSLDGDRIAARGFFDGSLFRDDATVFARQGSDWIPLHTLIPSTPGGLEDGGLALEGDTVVIGAPKFGPYPHSGVVYTYDLGATFPSFCDASDGALASCPCANPGNPDTGCDIAQATGGAKLDVFGQEFGPQNRATLTGSGFPTGSTPAVSLLRGVTQEAAPVVFGDGLRCTATPLVRLRAAFAIGGTTSHAIGHNTNAGTYHYQLWFRNTPGSFCTPGAFNLSNGRSLTW